MARSAWVSLFFGLALATSAVTASVGGCGSQTANGSPDSGGPPGSSGSSGSSGFTTDASTDAGASSSGNPGTSAACDPAAMLVLSPASQTATVSPGGTFSQSYTVTAGGADVTPDAFFTVSDPGAGSFAKNTFTWSGAHGGTLTVTATVCGRTVTATLTLKVSVTFGAGGGVDAGADGGADDDGGLTGTFNGAPPTGTATCNPSLVYPPDGVLIPPNMNVMEVHFTDGSPTTNKTFEISFENAVTDVKLYTTCSGATPDVGTQVGGGCVFSLSQAEWDYIAKTNRDGDPVVVKVKGLGCDPSGAEGVSNTRSISFARDDMAGTLYYWASMRIGTGGSVFSGGVYRYDFGVRGQTAEPVLTPLTTTPNPNGLCIGCHDISRDGRKMIFDFDDNDADDEYSDITTDIFDIASATPTVPIIKDNPSAFSPGFHSWNRETSMFLLSDGYDKFDAGAGGPGPFEKVQVDAGGAGYTRAGTLRGTTPNWSPDDANVVFSVPPDSFVTTAVPGYWMNKCPQQGGGTNCINDLMFAGANLVAAPWNATTKTLGAPTTIFTATTDNYYYPSYSPEGSLIVYNHAPSGSNFHNPLARVEITVAGAATPARDYLTALNAAASADATPNTNSWARWAPFVQTYKGQKLLWLTFSSTRNYGLRIDNANTQNCYPKESPNFVTPDFTSNPTPPCSSTQLWMAAVKLDAASAQAATDISFPAFYLPFQDITTNNHLAQWAQKSFTGTCTVDANCAAEPGKCCDNGGCTTCPTPPAATCAVDNNCAVGQCCNSGACGACPSGSDAGSSSSSGSSGQPGGCNTCLDCNNQACVNGQCGGCTNSSQCCAPLVCDTASGRCISSVN